jgi:hypothetical protein
MTYAALLLPIAMGLLGVVIGLLELRRVKKLAAEASTVDAVSPATSHGWPAYGTVFRCSFPMSTPLTSHQAQIFLKAPRVKKPSPRPVHEPEIRKRK